MNPRVEAVVIHPTCAVSYRIVKRLAREGLLERVSLLDARDPRVVMEYRVWSVPWILVETRDGLVPGGTDPISEDEVVAMIRGVYRRANLEPFEAFRDALIHSSFAAAVSLLNNDPSLVVSRELLAAAIRAGFDENPVQLVEENIRYVAERVAREWGSLKDVIARALGVSFVRELWWSRGGVLDRDSLLKAVDEGAVRLWLQSKASIGRGGIPWDPRVVVEAAEPIERFVSRGAVGLLKKVEKEQREILGDDEYWMLLKRYLHA